MGLETGKKFTGKLGKNANDVMLNPHSGVSVRRRCPLTGVRSFISRAGHGSRGSCAWIYHGIYNILVENCTMHSCELIFMQCRNAKIIVS